ncbi:MAG: hypothetical protein EOO41_01185 [Methanobacteriota archaeon]|nr:MAG: hypothetical protein EOO41_01185 [Euryarchaeota archaeon]
MRAMEREAAAAAATAAAEQPALSNSSVRTAPPPPPPRAQGPQLRTLVNRGTGEAVHAASDGDDCLQPQRPAVDGAAAAAAPPAVMPAARHAPGVRLVASEVAAVQPAVLASAAPPSRSRMLQMAVQSAQRVMPPAVARGDAAPHGQVQT